MRGTGSDGFSWSGCIDYEKPGYPVCERGREDMALMKNSPRADTCLICGRTHVPGIHVFNQLICDSCQQKMITTEVTDWKYRYYMNRLSLLKPEAVKPAAGNKAGRHQEKHQQV
jgi:Inhibitor of sigma-G Gin.